MPSQAKKERHHDAIGNSSKTGSIEKSISG
jgi:hypothetical protein